MRRVERTLAPAGLEAGMVDDEADVGIKPRDEADIDTARVMLGHAGEGQALVDADGADAEGPRLLDEGDADPRVVEIPALAAWAPLRIDLPRGDRPLARRPRHDVQRLGLGPVGDDHAVQQHPIAAFDRAADRSRPLALRAR